VERAKSQASKDLKLLSFECINKFCVRLKFCVLFYFSNFLSRRPFFGAHTAFHSAHTKQALRGNVGKCIWPVSWLT